MQFKPAIDHLEDVFGAVWLASAILAYQSFTELGEPQDSHPEERYFFKQRVIQELANRLCAREVHNARISQWTNGDHPDSSYNYLREVKGKRRRLTVPGEFNGVKEIPEGLLLPTDIVLSDVEACSQVTFGDLLDWVRQTYSLLIKKRPREQKGHSTEKESAKGTPWLRGSSVKSVFSEVTKELPSHHRKPDRTKDVPLASIAPSDIVWTPDTILLSSLSFKRLPLSFDDKLYWDVFGKKNNKTLLQTVEHPRYKILSDRVMTGYFDYLSRPIGKFLIELKVRGDRFYRMFLNNFGDLVYSKFWLGNNDWLSQRGLYLYATDGDVQYIGRCLDSFQKRINQGYGTIQPKECFRDGNSTNCRLNYLITSGRHRIAFFACHLDDEEEIKELEAALIEKYQPVWNIR